MVVGLTITVNTKLYYFHKQLSPDHLDFKVTKKKTAPSVKLQHGMSNQAYTSPTNYEFSLKSGSL